MCGEVHCPSISKRITGDSLWLKVYKTPRRWAIVRDEPRYYLNMATSYSCWAPCRAGSHNQCRSMPTGSRESPQAHRILAACYSVVASIYGIRNLKKRLRSIIYATWSIQGFTLILSMCTDDPDETTYRLCIGIRQVLL